MSKQEHIILSKPLFIALEGIDGSGKSSQSKLLQNWFERFHIPVTRTSEPTNNPIGALIRQGFNGTQHWDDRTIAGLFVADRLDHILNPEYGMQHALNKGLSVITDRYYLSSFAYQSAHMPMEWVIQANAMAMELLRPDVHFYIDISVELAMERIHLNRDHKELYETESNLVKVRNHYLEILKRFEHEERIVSLDGNRDLAAIHSDIINYLVKNFCSKQ